MLRVTARRGRPAGGDLSRGGPSTLRHAPLPRTISALPRWAGQQSPRGGPLRDAAPPRARLLFLLLACFPDRSLSVPGRGFQQRPSPGCAPTRAPGRSPMPAQPTHAGTTGPSTPRHAPLPHSIAADDAGLLMSPMGWPLRAAGPTSLPTTCLFSRPFLVGLWPRPPTAAVSLRLGRLERAYDSLPASRGSSSTSTAALWRFGGTTATILLLECWQNATTERRTSARQPSDEARITFHFDASDYLNSGRTLQRATPRRRGNLRASWLREGSKNGGGCGQRGGGVWPGHAWPLGKPLITEAAAARASSSSGSVGRRQRRGCRHRRRG